MHRKQAIFLFISLKITCIMTNPLLNILLKEKNFLHKINFQIHIFTNKLFNSLKLSQEFKKDTKIQGLLTMHSDLNDIAEKHNSVYDDIKTLSSSKVKGTTDLEKMFEDIINEETSRLKNDTIDKYHAINSTNSNDTLNHEFGFMYEVFNKMTKLFAKDIIRISNETQINIDQGTRDIKVWHLTSDEDKTNNKTRRIYKGKKTRIKRYPFLVSIHVMNEFSCAGSIISKDLVITAATCLHIAYNNSLHFEKSRSIFVRVGSDYTQHHGELIPITEILFHPGYDPVSLKNNLAIIRMMKRVKYSKKRKVQRIKYDRDGYLDDDNSVTILGWGAKDTNQETSTTHRVSTARLDIYNNDECKEIYSGYYVTDHNFCAGFESKGGGACNRDVGGPGIVSGKLVGIISFGPLVCGMADAPTVFTKLSSYAEWIDDTIKHKPKMRNAVTTKMVPKKPPRAFPMPMLTTPNLPHSVTKKSDIRIGTTEIIYPDEVILLKGILQEIVLSNKTVIDYILYGDMLDNEKNAKNIQTTTESVDISHKPLANKNSFQIERQNNIQPGTMKATQSEIQHVDVGSNSDEIDTGIKILESLVGYTAFDEKSSTAKARFNIEVNKAPEHLTTRKVNKNAERPVLKNDINIPNDSSSYYEDGTGISIEETRSPIKDPRETNYYPDKATTSKSNTSFKRIKLEDYKNVIFNLNPSRESRGIITVDKNKIRNLKNERSNTNFKNIQHNAHENVIFNLNPFQEAREITFHKKQEYKNAIKNYIKNIKSNEKVHSQNSKSNNELKINHNMNTADITNVHPGVAMEISDEDFEYDDMRQEFDNNMRSRNDDGGPLLWRYRSSI